MDSPYSQSKKELWMPGHVFVDPEAEKRFSEAQYREQVYRFERAHLLPYGFKRPGWRPKA